MEDYIAVALKITTDYYSRRVEWGVKLNDKTNPVFGFLKINKTEMTIQQITCKFGGQIKWVSSQVTVTCLKLGSPELDRCYKNSALRDSTSLYQKTVTFKEDFSYSDNRNLIAATDKLWNIFLH